MSKKNKILIYLKKIGPYHWARLQALSSHAELYIFTSTPTLNDKDEDIAYPIINSSGKLKVFYLSNPRYFRSNQQWDFLSSLSPDLSVLGAWNDPIALELLRWCRKRRVPAVVVSDTTSADKQRFSVVEWLKGILINSYSGALVAGTRQEEYVRGLGFRAPIEVGHNAVDNDFFRSGAGRARRARASFRKALGVPRYYFAIPARLVQEKSIHTAIKALALAIERGLDRRWCLSIAGKGPLKKQLEDFVAELNLQDRVSFIGLLNYENMPAFYALAGVTLLPSRSESWGLVINESMASGTPVIISDICGSATDLVKHGESGFIFECSNASVLADQMLEISRNSTLRRKMGSESLKLISEWGLERFVNAVLKLIGNINGGEIPELGKWENFFLWNLARI